MISLLCCILFFLFGNKTNSLFNKIIFFLTPFLICVSDSLILIWDKYLPLRPIQLLFSFYLGYFCKQENFCNAKKLFLSNRLLQTFFLLLSFEILNALRSTNQYLYFCKLFLLNEYPKYFCAIGLTIFYLNRGKLFEVMQVTALLIFNFLLFEIVTSFNWLFLLSSIYVIHIPEFASKLNLHFAPESIKNGVYLPSLRTNGLIYPARFSGFDGSPNTSAIYMAALSFFLLSIKGFSKHLNNSFKIILSFGVLLILVIGQTRAALFGFLIAALFYLKANKTAFKNVVISIFCFFVFLICCQPFADYFNKFINLRLSSKENIIDYQRESSFNYLKKVTRPIKILFGSGGNIYSTYEKILKGNDISIFGLQYLTGGFFFLFVNVVFIFYVIKALHNGEKFTANLESACCFLVLFLASLTNSYNFYWVYLILGLSTTQKGQRKN